MDIQNKKLDDFHLKDQIDRMNADVADGKILGSMHLGDNPHAQVWEESCLIVWTVLHSCDDVWLPLTSIPEVQKGLPGVWRRGVELHQEPHQGVGERCQSA